MKTTKTMKQSSKPQFTMALAVVLAIAASSCSNRNELPAGSNTPAAAPVMEPVLAAWQQGDEAAAVSRFLEADWHARPLFAANSVLGLTEVELKSLPPQERNHKELEMTAQTSALNRLASAVARAGRNAAARQDAESAGRHFAALRQCGRTLDRPGSPQLVQEVGQVMKAWADIGPAKMQSGQPTKKQEAAIRNWRA
jgi:hypothetical protein